MPAPRRRCAARDGADACPCGCASCGRVARRRPGRVTVSPTRSRPWSVPRWTISPAPPTGFCVSVTVKSAAPAARLAQLAVVADLAAALGVERSLVEDDLGLAVARSARRTRSRRGGSPRRGPRRSSSRSRRTSCRRRGGGSTRTGRRARRGARARPCVPLAAAVALLGEGRRRTRRDRRATPYSAASSTVRSIGKPYVSWSWNATSPGRTGASAGGRPGRRPIVALASWPAAGERRPRAGSCRRRASGRTAPPRARSRRGSPSRRSTRYGYASAIDLDDDARPASRQERLTAAEQASVPDRAADDPAQDVAAALVRGQDAVGDEERHGARVVGDDLVAEPLGLERVRVVPEQLAHPGVDRREQVGVVVGRDLLEHAGQPLEAHPGVDAGERQRHPAVGALVELHEHEVPDLEPARAVSRSGPGCTAAPRDSCDAAIEMDLAARPARSGVGHPPEVVVVAVVDVAPASPSARAAGRSRRARSSRATSSSV